MSRAQVEAMGGIDPLNRSLPMVFEEPAAFTPEGLSDIKKRVSSRMIETGGMELH
jgi:hypothetical protein